MAAYKGHAFHDDSDADDEYERSVITSPTLPPDFESSPTDSESLSTEHTPTTFSHSGRDNASPRGLITEWSAEQCADFVSSLGLPQYADSFVEEAITGDALIALLHSDLKEMGITSIGHRLTILKGVYDVKVKQNINVEPEHYMPLSAEAETSETGPTQEDIARIIHIIKDRDAELRLLKEDITRISEENRKLREDFLPLVKAAKDRSQPLPEEPSAPVSDSKGGLSRKFSTKRLFLSSGPKNPSPTIIQETRGLTDNANLDPSAAAMAASTHLTASMRDNDARSPSQAAPSPTSPGYNATAPNSGGPTSRPFPRSDTGDSVRETWNTTYSSQTDRQRQTDPPLSGGSLGSNLSSSTTIVPTPSATPSISSSSSATPTPGSTGGNNPQVEIFKSFRVSIDDPCHKVLPVALKKYNITADWRQYALYIVHGDQERCLGLNERPLILFKQLDKEGRKPMFMLRKHATPAEGHTVGLAGGSGRQGGGYGTLGVGRSEEMQLPGGVL